MRLPCSVGIKLQYRQTSTSSSFVRHCGMHVGSGMSGCLYAGRYIYILESLHVTLDILLMT